MYHPFFAYLALQIKFEPDEIIEKTSIDGVTFRYNPDYIQTLNYSQCAAIIAHGMCHTLLLHPLRAENKSIQRWDKATDYAVNSILKDSGIELMNDLYDASFNGVEAESIYELLEESEEQQNENTDSSGNGDGENGTGSGLSAGKSGANSSDSEQSENDNSDICSVAPPMEDGVSEQEQEQRMIQRVMDAAMQSEFAGSQLTEAIKTVINQLKEPKKDWREILLKFTAELARNDYDWEKPDLMYLQRNIYIPSLHSMDIGGIVFAIDTSASIDDELLSIFLSELKEAAELITKEITVIHCDTIIRKVEEVQSEEIDSIMPEGRGGTMFSPVFDYIKENDLEPKALIYFTDGRCYDTPASPDYPVIWCIYNNDKFNAPFGECVFIDK